ncbi:Alpha-amylase 3, chloroplastic-like protein [Drosera capensis]
MSSSVALKPLLHHGVPIRHASSHRRSIPKLGGAKPRATSSLRCDRRFPRLVIGRGRSSRQRRSFFVVGCGGSAATVAVEAAEIVYSETFSLKRRETVEGKMFIRLDQGKNPENWQLTVGCSLPGKWVLHWGVHYFGDTGSEWDQPPAKMRPRGSVAIKDYAIETPLKKLAAAEGGYCLHEVKIDFNCSCSIAAINFVLKDEETGRWYQNRGTDFKVPLVDYLHNGGNLIGPKRGFGLWPGALEHLSSIFIKPETPETSSEESSKESAETVQPDKPLEGFYEEQSIVKEVLLDNSVNVTIKKCPESAKKLVYLDSDLPGDVVIHWGVCRDNTRKWEIPADPYPPDTQIFKNKALRTQLQPKDGGLGVKGLFTVDEEYHGFLFVLKLKDETWLKFMENDFFVPLSSSSISPAQSEGRQREGKALEMVPELQSGCRDLDNARKEENEEASQTSHTDVFISEIRSLVTDMSSGKDWKTKSKEAQGRILREIEKLAAEAYRLFRGPSPTLAEENTSVVEAASTVELPTISAKGSTVQVMKPPIKISPGTGSGYEILCQGFNWESHKSGRWYKELQEKAKTLSSLGFTVIWLPPPTESVSPEGYMPKDLYNLNSRYGSIAQNAGQCHVANKYHIVHNVNLYSVPRKLQMWLHYIYKFIGILDAAFHHTIEIYREPQLILPCILVLSFRYGTIDELKAVIKRFHEVGIKVLGDVVLNHRCAHFKNQNGVWNLFGGRLNWDDRAIVADDPHFQGRGNKSSGDNFHAAPNIDHSQEFVRKDLKQWLHWLGQDIGYDGWRLDFVRGFWGGYVKDYMDASEPYFAVGEYWDSLSYTYGEMDYNQDAHRQRIIDWINATGGMAGAFDVTTKGILHAALEKCEYWRLSDPKGNPPGVVGWWPSRAVTFVENHDTGSTQGHWRFPGGKEMQGYAYILTHPGTPAVFYDHIFSNYQSEISALISLRNRNKINCRSMVKILQAERDVYAATIDDKVTMKIGPGYYEPPSGPRQWSFVLEGKDYKIWEAV